jgi:hypothetical protein
VGRWEHWGAALETTCSAVAAGDFQWAAVSGIFFSFFFFLPSHIPPALLAGARVWDGVRGPILIFR